MTQARPHPTGMYWLTRAESIAWDRDPELRARARREADGRTIVKDGGLPVPTEVTPDRSGSS